MPPSHPHADFLRGCARDALARLILPSLEREVRRELTERAETHAVERVRQATCGTCCCSRRCATAACWRSIPGYKSGCKLAALDQFGNLLDHAVIYLVGKPTGARRPGRSWSTMIERIELQRGGDRQRHGLPRDRGVHRRADRRTS